MSQKRVGYIDSLRGIACLFVLISHIVSVSDVGSYVSGCGKIGVWLFMILSSFLIIYPYEECRDKKINVLKFYCKKLLRIYPCYIFVLILAYLCGFITSGRQFLTHILALEGIGHFWYMPVIIKLYLFFPIFILLRRVIKEDYIYMTIIGVISVFFAFLFPYNNYVENSISIRWYVPVFGMGICLATVVKRLRSIQRKYWIADIGVIICLCIIFMITPFMKKMIFNIPPSGWLQNKYLLVSFVWFCMIVLIEVSCRCKYILEKCVLLMKIGKISYPIYLVHYVVLVKLCEQTKDYWIILIFTLIISILIALIIHYCIEEKINKIIKQK